MQSIYEAGDRVVSCGREVSFDFRFVLIPFLSNKITVHREMILLEVHNRIIEEVLTLQIESFLRKEKLVEIKTNIVGR